MIGSTTRKYRTEVPEVEGELCRRPLPPHPELFHPPLVPFLCLLPPIAREIEVKIKIEIKIEIEIKIKIEIKIEIKIKIKIKIKIEIKI